MRTPADPGSSLSPTEPDDSAPSAPPAFVKPASYGRYLLLDPLGTGGMGSVHAAWDRTLGRRVALKLVHTGAPERLLREAQALARLNHPNVVTVYDVGRQGDELFIAMELLDGLSLRRWLDAGPHRWQEVLRALVAAGRGLAAVHAAGLVHRDFKGDNVLLGKDGRVQVADFGLVGVPLDAEDTPAPPPLVLPGGADVLTDAGSVMGTPRYMAPEQRAALPVDARADQYSFCLTALEALTGEHPVTHDRPFPAPSGRLPGRLRAILERGMSITAGQRWPSMEALLAALVYDRPRRTARVLAPLLVVGAAALVWRHQAEAPARACAATARQPVAWGPSGHDLLRSAFVATGAPRAAQAAADTSAALDAYAADLRAMSQEACVTARVDGAQSEEVYDLRRACLARHGLGLRVLVEELLHPGPDAVADAAGAVHDLPPVADCGEVEALASPASVPANPALRAPVARFQAELSAVAAQAHAGRRALALVRLGALLPAVHALGFRALEGRIRLHLAATYLRLDHRPDAIRLTEDAMVLGFASGDDDLAAQATIALVRYRHEARKLPDARLHARLAEAALERLGPTGRADELRATLDTSLAGLARAGGDSVTAERLARRAVAVLERTNPRGIFAALWTLGSVNLDLDRPAEAEAIAWRALGVADVVGLPGDDRSRAYSILAQAAIRGRRYGEAYRHASTGLARIAEHIGPETLAAAALRNLRGLAAMWLERWDDALADFRHAEEIATRLGARNDVANYTANQAAVQELRFQWEEARTLYARAVAIRDEIDPSGGMLVNVASLIQVTAAAGRTAEARQLADRALPRAEKLDPGSVDAALVWTAAATAYRDDPAVCVPLLLRALPGVARRYGGSSPELAETLGDLGACQLAGGDVPTARATLERAHAMAPAALLPRARLALAKLSPALAPTLLTQALEGFTRRGDTGGAAEARRLLRQEHAR